MADKVNLRIEFLDMAKFIGLILVCFCHIPYPEGNFHIWVYSFHMPLFFFISGVFFSPEKFAVVKSAVQLLVPFVLFNLIALLISFLFGSIFSGNFKLPMLHWNAMLHGSYPIGPSWFLLSLCIIRVFTGLLLKWFNNYVLIGLSLIVMALFLLTQNAKSWSILSIGPSVLGLPFYLAGFYMKNTVVDIRHFNKWYISVATVILSILALYNGQVGVHATDYGRNILLFLVFGIVGTIAVISLSVWIHLPRRLVAVFMDGALFFICMHTLIFEYLILCWNKVSGDFSGNTLTEKIVFTILTFAVSFPIIIFLLRYAPFMLGKSKVGKKY